MKSAASPTVDSWWRVDAARPMPLGQHAYSMRCMQRCIGGMGPGAGILCGLRYYRLNRFVARVVLKD